MSHLRYVTLTGVDEKTSFAALKRLSLQYPVVEWGVLYSPLQAGTQPRYPRLEWIEAFAHKARAPRLNIALHLCGGAVRQLLLAVKDPAMWAEPAVQRLVTLASRFGRVQLNMRAKSSDVPALRELIRRLVRCEKRTRVILQWHDLHADVCRELGFEEGFEALVDSSGGRGLERASWPSLNTDVRRVGYAGGLGPINLAVQLPAMARACPSRAFWVDMESKLRDERDRFDLKVCAQVLEQAQGFIDAHLQAQGALWGTGTRAVRQLNGLWLHWWAAKAQGYPVVVPPRDAVRPVYLHRPSGAYDSVPFTESPGMLERLVSKERIGHEPLDGGRWRAWHKDRPDLSCEGRSMQEAALRVVVLKVFGERVPRNPAKHPS